MEEIKRIIFASDSGTSRAAMAAGILRSLPEAADFSVEARGLLVQFPEPLNQKAEAVMISNGIVWENFSSRQLEEYFAGKRKQFDLPLSLRGTEFQRQVWAALRDIPYGVTRSYGQIAQAVGRPKAVRAVGMANHRNPISIIVPCHRVVGADGSLTGYGGGLENKKFLLALERGCSL